MRVRLAPSSFSTIGERIMVPLRVVVSLFAQASSTISPQNIRSSHRTSTSRIALLSSELPFRRRCSRLLIGPKFYITRHHFRFVQVKPATYRRDLQCGRSRAGREAEARRQDVRKAADAVSEPNEVRKLPLHDHLNAEQNLNVQQKESRRIDKDSSEYFWWLYGLDGSRGQSFVGEAR
jgi:hypothetical protein